GGDMLNKEKNKKGFTIVELVIVIIIIGTLVAIIVPTFLIQVEQAEISATKANLNSIRSAQKLYFIENDRHNPPTIQSMVDSGYLRVFPEEMLTPSKAEKNVGGVDGSGGWYYEYRGDTQEPIIKVNLLGKDKNGMAFSEY
ncbi:MAG TPA: prepilin-type N-terminal cleavage/methylation domain-containing protein, partial [bacterium]|nr:prepilin-type N-terminal cleavage/methylation domain-containing protein [bacterium]